LYNEKVLDHFNNPRNVGELENPDGVGEVGNPVCGDIMRMEIAVEDGRIKDIRFRTFGCGAAIATSSMVTELVKGKTLEEALAVTNRMVAEALGGLTPVKMHCSNLAADALHKAIDDYLSRAGAAAADLGAGERAPAAAAAGCPDPSADPCPGCCGKIGRERGDGPPPGGETPPAG